MTVPEPRRVLVLITNPAVNSQADFAELAVWIAEASPETAVFVLADAPEADVLARVPDLPTLTVSPAPVRRLRPRRGPLLQGQHVAKSVEYRALDAIGIPAALWLGGALALAALSVLARFGPATTPRVEPLEISAHAQL